MEKKLENSPQFECSIDIDDPKYLCRLSTILVANIQEVKDRISHIEFIFCSQLFPNFQSRSGLIEKRLVEARSAAEGDWKKKERILLRQVEELHLEKQHAKEQVQQLTFSLEQSNERLVNTERLLSERECEQKKLLEKLENLGKNEEIIAQLKEQLGQKASELALGKQMQERLSQHIELKDDELLVERSKRRVLVEECKIKYKELKSQYNFLLKKTGCTTDSKPHPDRMEEDKVSSMPSLNRRSLQDKHVNHPASTPNEMNSVGGLQEKHVVDRAIGVVRSSDADSRINLSSSSAAVPPKHISGDAQAESSGGLKRAASCWRETRIRQGPRGTDPHDDFLDTPMAAARNLNMGPREEVQVFPVPAPKDLDFNNSDDETQEISAETVPKQQQISVLRPVSKGFKYVEPVRKKAERENLKGVECKQCKKFYEAVLPDGNNEDATNGHNGLRCEHHDGVSRHRYRYAPPSTPEGFWNIGFESEM